MINEIKRAPELQALLPMPQPKIQFSVSVIKSALAMFVLFAMAMGLLVFAAFQAKEIYEDYKVKDQLEFVSAQIDGKCRSHLIVLTTCNVKVKVGGKTYPQDISFFSFKNGDYSVTALRDPNNIDYVTLDLAVEKMGARAMVVLFWIAVSGLLFWLLILILFIRRPRSRHVFDELNRGNIELALYRFDEKMWEKKNTVMYQLMIHGKLQKMYFGVNKKQGNVMPFILSDATGSYMIVVYDPTSEYFVILNQSLISLNMDKTQRKMLKEQLDRYIAQQL